MQLHILYERPIEAAQNLNPAEMQDMIANCGKAVAAIKNGQVPKGLEGVDAEWLDRYRLCLAYYSRGDVSLANWWSNHADLVRPAVVTPEFCAKNRAAVTPKPKAAPKPKKQPKPAEG